MAASLSCQVLCKLPASLSSGSRDAKPNSSAHFASESRCIIPFGVGCKSRRGVVAVRVATQDSLSDLDDNDFPLFPIASKAEKKNYPVGLQRYETMVVLRPDLTEEERFSVTERYEEFLVAGGALDVELFNRGMQPLAYRVKTKNMVGTLSEYEDGIFLLFTYATKPESQRGLQQRLNADDDVIRASTFKLKA